MNLSECRSCKKSIYWLKTRRGKNISVDADSVRNLAIDEKTIFDARTMKSHFSTCPHSGEWKGKKNKGRRSLRDGA